MNVYSLNGRVYEWLTAALTWGRVNQLKRQMMPKLNLQPGHCLLDWGCGAGAAQRIALPYLKGEGRVVGIDVSASLVQRANARAPQSDGLEFTFIVRDGFDVQLLKPADAAMACHSLGVLPSELVESGIQEIWRNLRGGARILITDMYAPRQTSPLKNRLQSMKKLVAGGLFKQNFSGGVLGVVERYFQELEIIRRDDLMAFAYLGVRRDEPLSADAQIVE